MPSHLTQSEIDALQLSTLPRDTPYIVQGVSHTQFSVARHYGGMTYQGKFYSYIPTTDELIRDDVVKWLKQHRKPAKQPPQPATRGLFSEG